MTERAAPRWDTAVGINPDAIAIRFAHGAPPMRAMLDRI